MTAAEAHRQGKVVYAIHGIARDWPEVGLEATQRRFIGEILFDRFQRGLNEVKQWVVTHRTFLVQEVGNVVSRKNLCQQRLIEVEVPRNDRNVPVAKVRLSAQRDYLPCNILDFDVAIFRGYKPKFAGLVP